MTKFIALLFAVFLIISTAAGILNLNKFIYKYSVSIKTFTNTPEVFTSELLAEADLIVTTYQKEVYCTLKDVTYSMYNGKGIKRTNILQIPMDSKSIELPFGIKFGKNGMVDTISTDTKDEAWSINMKKAIAATLQLDINQILATRSSSAFYSDEYTVYGKCNIFYTVLRQNFTHMTVKKHYNPVSCKGFSWESNINANPSVCEAKFENPLAISSDRHYEVSISDKGLIINRAETINTIILAPFSSNGDSFSVVTNQTFRFVKYEELKDTPEEVGKNYHKLKVNPVQYDEQQDVMFDITGGRANLKNEETMESALTLLEAIAKNLEHTQTQFSDTIKPVTLGANQLIFYLKMLNYEYLEKVYSSLASSYQQKITGEYPIFLAALPHVGTLASCKLIKKIVAEQKLNEFLRPDKLLQDLPFYIKYPNKMMIEELMPLTVDTGLPETTRNLAKLTVATVIGKVLERYPEDEEVQKYVDEFIEKFISSEEYLDKLTYLSSLINIGSKKTTKYIEKFIKEDKISHLRSFAIFGVKNNHFGDMDHSDKILWPLLENESESFEVRFAAMAILMHTNFSKLHWYMQTVEEEELYNLYYNLLQSYSGSTLPCFNKLSLRAKKILTITRKPLAETSFIQLPDYFDSNFGFGAQLKLAAYGNIYKNKYTTFYGQIAPNLANLNLNQEALYVHIDVTHKNITYNAEESETGFEYYEMLWKKAVIFGQFPLEIIKFKHGKITFAETFQSLHDFDILKMNRENNIYNFDQSVSGESIITTDIGINVMTYLYSPSIWQLKGFLKEHGPKINLKYSKNENNLYGILFYNPLVDLWQGAQRTMTSTSYFPFNLYIDNGASVNSVIYNFTENRSYGFQSYVSSNVFIIDAKNDTKKLLNTCPECKSLDIVTKKDTLKTEMLVELAVDFLGLSVGLEVFDCDKEISDTQTQRLKEKLTIDDNKNFNNALTELMVILKHTWDYATLMPAPGRCGVKFVVTPENSYANFSKGRFPISENSEEFYTGFKYEMYQNDKVANWWGCLNVGGSTRSKQNIHCTYKHNSTFYKLCFERKLEYGLEYDHKFYLDIKIGKVDDAKKCPEDTSITIIINRPESYKRKSLNIIEEIVDECKKGSRKIPCVKKFMVSQNISLDINYKNVPSREGILIYGFIIDELKKQYSEYYHDIETENTKEGNIKMSFHSDLNDFIMEYISSTEKFRLKVNKDEDYDIYRYIYEFINWGYTYQLDVIDNCRVGLYDIYNYNLEKKYEGVSKEWTEIAGYKCDCPEEWKLFAKQAEDSDHLGNTYEYVALRIESAGDTLDIHFNFFKNAEIFLNGELLKIEENQKYFQEKWFDLKLYNSIKFAIVYLKNSKKLLVFDKEYSAIRVVLPKEYFKGKCQMESN